MDSSHTYVYTKEALASAVSTLHALMPKVAVFTFTGTLGAGKTTVISEFMRQCGVVEPVTSPTFTYMNVYHAKDGSILYHFDLYRLTNMEEFVAAGFAEYLYQPHSWAFIEWPDIIMPLLPHRVCHVALEYVTNDERRLSYKIQE